MTLKTGIHNVPVDDYHADLIHDDVPTLSSSIAHTLLKRSPRHAWWEHPRLNPNHEPRSSGTMDHGTAVHALLFEHKAPEVIQLEDGTYADSFRKHEAQALRDAARKAGRVPLLQKDATVVKAMTDAIGLQLAKHDADPRPFTDGKAEQTLVWEEPGGVWCRARLDWLRDDRVAIDDLKTTTTADPREWSRRRLWEDGKDIQCAFYLRGLRAVTKAKQDTEWRFVVVENQPPYALSVISLDDQALKLGAEKVEKAIAAWRECLQTDEWPAYPNRVCYAELPPWEEARFLEKQMLEEMGAAS